MCELYERINELCTRRGITGYKLCKDTGIRPSILTDLKMGRSQTLSTGNLAKIAEYFGVSVDYLLGNKKEPAEASELDKYIDMLRTRPEMRLLLDTQDGATKEQVEENVRFLDALRKSKSNAD